MIFRRRDHANNGRSQLAQIFVGLVQRASITGQIMKARRALFVLAFVEAALIGSAKAAEPEVISWGMNLLGAPTTNTPPGISNVIALETAPIINMALLADGTIAAWGGNDQGQLDAIARLTNVAAISGGFTFVLAAKRDGTVGVGAWGNNQGVKTNIPPGISNVVGVAAGGSQCLALLSDGTVTCWGESLPGIPFVLPPGLSNVVDVQATLEGGLCLKADGTLTALGEGFSTAPPPGLSNIVAISTSFAEDFMALRSDGTVVTWTGRTGIAGYRDPLPAPPFSDPLVAVNMEHYHSLGIAQDGSFRVWRLRFDPSIPPPEPYIQIPQETATGVIAFAAGREYNVALVGEFGWPQITHQPENVALTDGQSATFHVEATSTLPQQYQWSFNGINLIGETNTTLTISSVSAANAGPYGVVISAGIRRIRSQPAWLTVVPTIQVERAGGQVKLTWPMSGAEYWLEEADDAAQPFRTAFENVVTNAVTGRIEIALGSLGHARFFRLWQP
jgi:Immunoglobulin domain